jgi:glucan phosphoethanolaminetransferase (alkaline phosphatase superfamily)
MQQFLKPLAFGCKILAAMIWLGAAWFKIGYDIVVMHSSSPPREGPTRGWGTPAYYHWFYLEMFVFLVVALLAVVPNRWLVFSRIAFSISLIVALFPFCVVLIHDWTSDPFMSLSNYLDPGALAFAAFIFGPLPLALTLSFWRQQKGEKVTYA